MGLVAWAFLYYGHQDVRLLDGGFEKWSREGRPVSPDEVSYPTTTFNAKPVEAIYCSLSHAKASHGRPATVFWDTRSLAEFHGAGEGHGNLPPGPDMSQALPIWTGSTYRPGGEDFQTRGRIENTAGVKGHHTRSASEHLLRRRSAWFYRDTGIKVVGLC
jgi:3-mercaptopyruvate sulfurtransferase SseA